MDSKFEITNCFTGLRAPDDTGCGAVKWNLFPFDLTLKSNGGGGVGGNMIKIHCMNVKHFQRI